MLDNLFGFAGPLGTAFALVGLLAGAVVFVMMGGKVSMLAAGPASRRARI